MLVMEAGMRRVAVGVRVAAPSSLTCISWVRSICSNSSPVEAAPQTAGSSRQPPNQRVLLIITSLACCFVDILVTLIVNTNESGTLWAASEPEPVIRVGLKVSFVAKQPQSTPDYRRRV